MQSPSPSHTGKVVRPVGPSLLGHSDGPISSLDDTDPYISKLGGAPAWFNSEKQPSREVTLCGVCGKEMALLVQVYAPLPGSAYERHIHIWACNRSQCSRQTGSVRAVREIHYSKEYAAEKAAERLEKERREEAAKVKKAVPPAFALGDLFGGGMAIGKGQSQMEKILAVSKEASYASTAASSPLASLTKSMEELTVGHSNKKGSIAMATDAWVMEETLPGYYLSVDEEIRAEEEGKEDLFKGLEQYRDLADQVMEEAADLDQGEGGEWEGEVYEKMEGPRGFDKGFRQFTERVQEWPEQCLRYRWAGEPLLYSNKDAVGKKLKGREDGAVGACGRCGGRRVYEMQVMPHAMTVLGTSEHAPEKGGEGKEALSVGMEWGTILVYVCEEDCGEGMVGGESRFVEETVLVQVEAL